VLCFEANDQMNRSFIVLLVLQMLHVCSITGKCLPGEDMTHATGNNFCGQRCIVGQAIDLGIAWRYAIFASTAMTDTPVGSSITGYAGTAPAVTIPAATRVTGEIHLFDETAKAVKAKMLVVASEIRARSECVTTYAAAVEFGGQTLKQGIYESTTTITSK